MIRRTECPICQRVAEIIFARSYALPAFAAVAARTGLGQLLADKSYEIRRCPVCTLHFQSWVMEDHELGGLYSPPAEADFFLGEIGRQKLHWFAHMTEEILVFRQLCRGKVPRVLDFGCNWGKWASMALAHGCEVFGVDVNRDAAAFCSQRGIKTIDRKELPGLRFDFINVDQVFEHLSEPLNIARLLAGSLKSGAWLKMGTPDNPNLPRLLAAAQRTGSNDVLDPVKLDSLAPLEHVNLFDHRSLKALAAQAGLDYFQLPFFTWLGAGQLWNIPRQLNRNIVTPWKRWRGRGTYLWFQKQA